jgi:hypothetical protein
MQCFQVNPCMFGLFQCGQTSELNWSTVITDKSKETQILTFDRCFRPVPSLLVNCTHAFLLF